MLLSPQQWNTSGGRSMAAYEFLKDLLFSRCYEDMSAQIPSAYIRGACSIIEVHICIHSVTLFSHVKRSIWFKIAETFQRDGIEIGQTWIQVPLMLVQGKNHLFSSTGSAGQLSDSLLRLDNIWHRSLEIPSTVFFSVFRYWPRQSFSFSSTVISLSAIKSIACKDTENHLDC